ncbi:PrpF domain-containing protein [Paenibacillus validus]|uniref:PrpF protein n=1 Tax=Paenibacillus validus TaxID=44253 RepID=A0A7X2ZDP2_9BACL|nr:MULTISPECIES: PrpF domain-containing protein [Paenibacillus]MED4601376.1 PrpF domain-containing protein [Paenibacillus validus]MED4605079.1 PrpF domain-containing protein [Paenibacillus validus]MUG72934.1 PrpF protein [Paenibacillus validus]
MYDFGQIHKIPAVIMRGGTSKGLVLRNSDLPWDPALRDEVIIRLYGTPDINQIDGLGGGTPLQSKLALVGRPSHPDADIDYTFGQVSLKSKRIDYNVTCGNFVTAVGLYAAEEGYVELKEPTTHVHIYNTNTNKIIVAEIPVKNGQIQYEGDYVIDGVSGASSRIMINFLDSGGGFTGRTLPTGNPVDLVQLKDGRDFQVTIIDCANVVIFVRATDLGLKGIESETEINGHPHLLDTLEHIRVECGLLIGVIKEEDRAAVSPSTHALPKIALVSSSSEYTTNKNKLIQETEVDIVSRYISMGSLHRAYAVSGAMALATATKIPDTIPNQLFSSPNPEVKIGHPSGILEVESVVVQDGNNWRVTRAANGRTARRLMEGYAHVPAALLRSWMPGDAQVKEGICE